jgi:putative NADPH-quinone reductase
MEKNILIINGHPNSSSFNFAIAESYLKGAIASKATVDTITIAKLDFNPNLQFGYQKRTELEPDLLAS